MSVAKSKPVETSQAVRFELPAALRSAYRKAVQDWEAAGNTERLWQRDPGLWTGQLESQHLGWLDIVDHQLRELSKFKALTAEIQEDGFTHILLLGMGGASLAAEVYSRIFGKQPGSPELLTLDSTDPAQIRAIRERILPARTLFCVASKSGVTLETNFLLQFFFDQTRDAIGERAGHHFVAITDPGSPLEGLAQKLGFRRVYPGVPTVKGRYSALSDLGLIPHAAAGLDTERLLLQCKPMVEACRHPAVAQNPGVALGLLLAVAAENGTNQATLLCCESLEPAAAWIQKLLAESTGKQGRGVIPIVGEPPVPVVSYGRQRLFIALQLSTEADDEWQSRLEELDAAGLASVRVELADLSEIGQLLFQWEVAAAVACSRLKVNPFDQPDVELSRQVAVEMLQKDASTGTTAEPKAIFERSGLAVYADSANASIVARAGKTLGAILRAHIDRIEPQDYFALLAYLPMTLDVQERFLTIRKLLVESKQVPVLLQFGPRYLHSTGQLFHGGPNTGVFIQFTCDDEEDVEIPQQGYSFGAVKSAQARADLQALSERNRRILRLHLSRNILKDLDHVCDLVAAAVAH